MARKGRLATGNAIRDTTFMMSRALFLAAVLMIIPTSASAAPPPPADLVDWPMPWSADAPGVFAADALLPKPAGKAGGVVVRDGHFFTGAQRLRLWGVNICFSGCFPTHEQADATAARLARFGVNAVRFHHMDSRTFPGGIWEDAKLEKLSAEALDRLDYFVAALKRQGVYSDINLHVSRTWSKAHNWENADKLPESYDKLLDIFHPDLIAAQKQYARDLLTHTNAYTKTRYADEPAVAVVEINNEDTLFLWSGERVLANLPEPYAGLLQKQWNAWLAKKYPTREKLRDAWAGGAQPLGENMLRDTAFASLGGQTKQWICESHDAAKMTAAVEQENGKPSVKLDITAIGAEPWHLQFNQAQLRLKKGQYYTVRFAAKSKAPVQIEVGVSMAHEPWASLGLSASAALTEQNKPFEFGFTASSDEDNARLSFSVGQKVNAVYLAGLELRAGGLSGLQDGEDPAQGTVARGGQTRSATKQRMIDWYDFLQQTDEGFFVEMRRFLKEELGVKCPITGTIGLGPLGTLSQSKMDFVDAHNYWDHPRFPRKPWDSRDWLINNKPMVDAPERGTVLGLGITRVEGKPFTVTEYNHAAPNEWQADTVPMIAAYAALQDWDGVFLFAYSHSDKFQKAKMESFFDIEGNPLKMPLMPLAARLFLGPAIKAPPAHRVLYLAHDDMLATGSRFYNQLWSYATQQHGMTWQKALSAPIAISFTPQPPRPMPPVADDPRITWTSGGPATYTGRFTVRDDSAAIFVGFAEGKMPIDLGFARIEKLSTPFASIMLVPADPSKTLESADRLLLCAVARAQNTDMQWNEARTSVSDKWGQGPPRIEVVKGTLSLAGTKAVKVYPLTPEGARGEAIAVTRDAGGRLTVELGAAKTLWYEIER